MRVWEGDLMTQELVGSDRSWYKAFQRCMLYDMNNMMLQRDIAMKYGCGTDTLNALMGGKSIDVAISERAGKAISLTLEQIWRVTV